MLDEVSGVLEIGEKLNVGHLPEGSVRMAGNRVRVTATHLLGNTTEAEHILTDLEVQMAESLATDADFLGLANTQYLAAGAYAWMGRKDRACRPSAPPLSNSIPGCPSRLRSQLLTLPASAGILGDMNTLHSNNWWWQPSQEMAAG